MLERLLLLWLTLLSLLAYYWPQFVPVAFDTFLLNKPYLSWLIAATMFSIGSLLPRDEVRQLVQRWPVVFGGTTVQYLSMPLLAYGIGMQNAGLGAFLILEVFKDEPAAAIPMALYTFGCMFTGTILARLWPNLEKREKGRLNRLYTRPGVGKMRFDTPPVSGNSRKNGSPLFPSDDRSVILPIIAVRSDVSPHSYQVSSF